MSSRKYVIIGNGAAGVSALESIRSVDRDVKLTVISDEPYVAYSKVLLHYYIDSVIDDKVIFIRTEKFYRDLSVETVFGTKVEGIDPENQIVYLASKEKIYFDKLLIATGSVPRIPPVKNVDQAGIYPMWTLGDARNIRRATHGSDDAIVIGASFIGMQALDSLKKLGLKVTIVDLADKILPNILDNQSSEIVRNYLEEQDVQFILNTCPVELKTIKHNKKLMTVQDGRTAKGDFCIIAVGAKPNIDLVEGTAIKRNRGLLVDLQLRTNYHNIFAAGDIAEVRDFQTGERKTFGLWSTAVEQGKIAGLNMAGKRIAYPGGMDMNVTNILGLPILTIGNTNMGEGIDGVTTTSFTNSKHTYRKFIFKNELLIGAILVGYVDDGGLIGSLIRSKAKFDPSTNKYSLGSAKIRSNYLTCR